MQAVILVGGLGSRLKSVIKNVPKPMAKIKGTPFLEILLDHWGNKGVKKFILLTGYKSEIIENYFGESFQGIPIKYSIETQPLGTGGALINSFRHIDPAELILLLNGDTFFPIDIKIFIEFFLKKKCDVCFSLFEKKTDSRYMSIHYDKKNKIISFDHTGIDKCSLYNGGVYLINYKFIKFLKKQFFGKFSIEHDVYKKLVNQSDFYGLKFNEKFIDIGVPRDYLRAKNFVF